jgi:hypothetical protein
MQAGVDFGQAILRPAAVSLPVIPDFAGEASIFGPGILIFVMDSGRQAEASWLQRALP